MLRTMQFFRLQDYRDTFVYKSLKYINPRVSESDALRHVIRTFNTCCVAICDTTVRELNDSSSSLSAVCEPYPSTGIVDLELRDMRHVTTVKLLLDTGANKRVVYEADIDPDQTTHRIPMAFDPAKAPEYCFFDNTGKRGPVVSFLVMHWRVRYEIHLNEGGAAALHETHAWLPKMWHDWLSLRWTSIVCIGGKGWSYRDDASNGGACCCCVM